jgi:DNA-binding CsgD family transcriptional regulator
MRNVVFKALCATLDQLSVGFVASFADGRVLHANRSAQEMMAYGSPIRLHHGYIQGGDRKRTDLLLKGLRQIAEEAAIPHAQNIRRDICLAVTDSAKGAAVVTLKPLLLPAGSPDRDECVVALFVTESRRADRPRLSGIAECFDLTPAETRTLEHFVDGGSVAEVAEALVLSANTVKTHLQSIFTKTNSSRQPELVKIVNELRPPLRAGAPERASSGHAHARRPRSAEGTRDPVSQIGQIY